MYYNNLMLVGGDNGYRVNAVDAGISISSVIH